MTTLTQRVILNETIQHVALTEAAANNIGVCFEQDWSVEGDGTVGHLIAWPNGEISTQDEYDNFLREQHVAKYWAAGDGSEDYSDEPPAPYDGNDLTDLPF